MHRLRARTPHLLTITFVFGYATMFAAGCAPSPEGVRTMDEMVAPARQAWPES